MCTREVWHTEMHMCNTEQVTYGMKNRIHSILVRSSWLRQVGLPEEQWELGQRCKGKGRSTLMMGFHNKTVLHLLQGSFHILRLFHRLTSDSFLLRPVFASIMKYVAIEENYRLHKALECASPWTRKSPLGFLMMDEHRQTASHTGRFAELILLKGRKNSHMKEIVWEW